MNANVDELQFFLDEGIARHRVPGASIAVFDNGKLAVAAAGTVNVATGVDLTSDTIMLIGSITKLFNTTLLMQLVDEHKIEMDAPIAGYLPDFELKDRQALSRITVKMLLNHTCGIDGDMLPDSGHDEETIEKGIARFEQLGQMHPPGTEVSYCNAGAVVAGYLAQRVTGESWYSLIKTRIFEPLQIEHAATLPEEALLHRAAVGHYFNPAADERPRRASFAFLPLSFAPCGTTLMLSAEGLIKFAMVHMNEGIGLNGTRILSESSVRAMRQPTVRTKDLGYMYTDSIGLGWMIYDDGVLHHVGGGPGSIAVLYVHPQSRFAAAALVNAEHGLGLINELMELWPAEIAKKKPFQLGRDRQTSAEIQIAPGRYEGVYEGVVNRYRVSATSRGLSLSAQAKFSCYESMSTRPTAPRRLIALEDDKFLLEGEPASESEAIDINRIFVFKNPDSTGRMLHMGNSMRLYPRVT